MKSLSDSCELINFLDVQLSKKAWPLLELFANLQEMVFEISLLSVTF